jgi:hypothetical protein
MMNSVDMNMNGVTTAVNITGQSGTTHIKNTGKSIGKKTVERREATVMGAGIKLRTPAGLL